MNQVLHSKIHLIIQERDKLINLHNTCILLLLINIIHYSNTMNKQTLCNAFPH